MTLLTIAIPTCPSLYLLAKPLSAFGLSAGYLMCSTISLIIGTQVFFQKRKERHAGDEPHAH